MFETPSIFINAWSYHWWLEFICVDSKEQVIFEYQKQFFVQDKLSKNKFLSWPDLFSFQSSYEIHDMATKCEINHGRLPSFSLPFIKLG